MLLFKKRFLPAIRAGTKTQTVRLWPHRRVRAGQRSYIPGAGYIRICEVEEVALDALSDADAVPDGFASAAELRRELETLYPDEIRAGFRAFRVVFVMLNAAEQEAACAERAARKAGVRDGKSS